jgi:hypothetical protein
LIIAQSISEIPEGLMKNGCTLKKYPRNVSKAKVPSTKKKTWRDSLPIDMLSAISVLVVAQSIFEIPDGLMNNPVYLIHKDITVYFIQHSTDSACYEQAISYNKRLSTQYIIKQMQQKNHHNILKYQHTYKLCL